MTRNQYTYFGYLYIMGSTKRHRSMFLFLYKLSHWCINPLVYNNPIPTSRSCIP